jgi:nicotinate dehydrogenase subunit A
MTQIKLKVNGESRTVNVEPATPLLYVLRNDLELRGPRFGCGLAQCGACSVIMEGNAIRSCVTPVSAAANKNITTLEGLGTVAKPHPLQVAFIEEQAAQCGYCMNGMIINAKVLLDKNPHPSEDDIKKALDPILCRCGSHLRVIRAIRRAAGTASTRAKA